MQDQMSAEQFFLMETGEIGQGKVHRVMQKYLEYVRSIEQPPFSVKEAIEAKYPLVEIGTSDDDFIVEKTKQNKSQMILREAATFGYSLAQRVDWEKLRAELLEYLADNNAMYNTGTINTIFDFFKQRLSLQNK